VPYRVAGIGLQQIRFAIQEATTSFTSYLLKPLCAFLDTSGGKGLYVVHVATIDLDSNMRFVYNYRVLVYFNHAAIHMNSLPFTPILWG